MPLWARPWPFAVPAPSLTCCRLVVQWARLGAVIAVEPAEPRFDLRMHRQGPLNRAVFRLGPLRPCRIPARAQPPDRPPTPCFATRETLRPGRACRCLWQQPGTSTCAHDSSNRPARYDVPNRQPSGNWSMQNAWLRGRARPFRPRRWLPGGRCPTGLTRSSPCADRQLPHTLHKRAGPDREGRGLP